jgi:hypothetical protein
MMMDESTTPSYDDLLRQVWEFPLLEALFGRRARRFARGMEIPSGPLAFKSRHTPLPLAPFERDLLVAAAAGVSGWNFGIPFTPAESPGGCSYAVRFTGRTFPSGAAIHTGELFYTDDTGTYFVPSRDRRPLRVREVEGMSDTERVLAVCRGATVRLSDTRLEIPRRPPHISEHNFWNANVHGSVLFLPVVDMSQRALASMCLQLVNGGYLYDDFARRPCGDLDPFFRSGLLQEGQRVNLSGFEQNQLANATAETAILGHNITLVMQAMGLGGWLYTGINPNTALGAFADAGIPGLGFRFTRHADWSVPNPVGLDGHYQGMCPPYYPDMQAAACAFAQLKFGPGGTYDLETPGPFQRTGEVKGSVKPYSKEFVDALGEMAQYIHTTYGRFPATIDPMMMNIWFQAHHLDTEFYDAHFGKGAYLDTHAQHLARWHGARRE